MLHPHLRTLKITGGEPTLHPEFAELIKEIDGQGVPFTVFTNARWENPEKIISLFADAKNFVGLLISLHGAEARIHEAFSGVKGSWGEACENITRAVKAGLRVHTSTVLNKYNIHQLEQIVELARKLGARREVFNRFLGPSDSPYQPIKRELKQAIRQIEGLCSLYPARTDGSFGVRYGNCIPQCFSKSSSSGCLAGVAYCTIDPWGRLRPCNHSPTIAGSLFEHSLETLWQGESMQRWRALTPDTCMGCASFEQCQGSCRALAEIEGVNGDPLMRSPMKLEHQPQHLELYSYAKPKLKGELLSAPNGWALAQGVSIMQVSEDALPVINTLNGNITLEELRVIHGQDALDFVGEIIRRGFVDLM